jgi:hypothetical protein
MTDEPMFLHVDTPNGPSAFADLPADAFPLTMIFFDETDRRPLHAITVEGPGATRIPGKKFFEDLGAKGSIGVQIKYGNGEVHESDPPMQ